MIKLEDVTTDCFSSVSFEIKEGFVSKIITDSDYKTGVLLDTILGIRKPMAGKVFLFGRDIYSISGKELFNIFKRLGMVWAEGGVISNLKVWENITLPLWYHTGQRPETVQDKVIGIFSEMGKDISYISGFMTKLTGPLPTHEKRLINIVRAMLTEPELIIYDSIFGGLDPQTAETLIGLTEKFHSGKSGRTSVYISSDELSLSSVKADIVLKHDGKGFCNK